MSQVKKVKKVYVSRKCMSQCQGLQQARKCVSAAFIYSPPVRGFVASNPWTLWTALGGSLVLVLLLSFSQTARLVCTHSFIHVGSKLPGPGTPVIILTDCKVGMNSFVSFMSFKAACYSEVARITRTGNRHLHFRLQPVSMELACLEQVEVVLGFVGSSIRLCAVIYGSQREPNQGLANPTGNGLLH
eukprot:scaffold75093_cov25-Tisochrysis_lutea.AAC.1